jgi:hypothetical protein
LRLGAVAEDAAKYFKQGLSGATATLTRTDGTVVPFAMVVRVEPDQNRALALRFDRIRAAFKIVEAARLSRARQGSDGTGLPFSILSFDAITRGDGPATALAQDGGCWRAAPSGGKHAVQITVALPGPETAVHGLSLVQAAGCGAAPAHVIVSQRVHDDDSWSTAAQCDSVAVPTAGAACRLDMRTPRQLRIEIVAQHEIGVSAIRLY